jgi:hypothetical protein
MIIDIQPQGTCLRWKLMLSHGARKSNPLLLFLQQKSSTTLLPKVPMNVFGYEDCMKKLKIENSKPTMTFCDNHNTMKIVKNHVFMFIQNK